MWNASDPTPGKLSKPRRTPSQLKTTDTKRRPGLLRKESNGHENRSISQRRDEYVTGASAIPAPKRRFSLKDAVRRMFTRRQERRSSLPTPLPKLKDGEVSTSIPSIRENSNGTTLIERPQTTEPWLDAVGGQPITIDDSHIANNVHSDAFAPRQVLSIGSDSSTSVASNDSLDAASTVLLPPRPVQTREHRLSSANQMNEHLIEADALAFFDGAPTFHIDETEGKYGEALVRYPKHPSQPSTPSSFCQDTVSIDHDALRGCSNRKLQKSDSTDLQHHWLNGPVETPSMLSCFGQEPGSTGWQYFLETQVLDFELQEGNISGEVDEYGFDFQPPDSIGVRSIDSTIMIDRLRDIGKLHGQAYKLEHSLDIEARSLFGQLFTKLLYPARKNSDVTELHEYSLECQCRELFKVLEERHVWLDFSRPEERIRLGSILYGTGQEKLFLVLQILLSCELWLRLKLLHKYEQEKLELGSLYFTQKVNWDLAIAQAWLANVRIVERPFTPDFEMLTPAPQTQPNSSWHRFFLADTVSVEDAEDPQEADMYDAFFVSQHLERQLDGLLHFARKIDWPGIEMLEGVIRDKLRDPTGLQTPGSTVIYRTPAQSPGKLTPRSISGTAGNSYFGYFASKHASSAIARNMGQGGWLSRTYLTGLVLPGEGLSHLLMGSLLESDTLALNEIGEHGTMYGGIIRRTLESPPGTASWWSMNNIVGKVLATTVSQSYAGWVGKCVGIYSAEKTASQDLTVLTAVAAKLVRNFTTSAMASTQREGMRIVEPTGWVDIITNRRASNRRTPRLFNSNCVESDSGYFGPHKFSGSFDNRVSEEELEYPKCLSPQAIQIEILGLRFWDRKSVTASLPELKQGYHTEEAIKSDEEIPSYLTDIVFRVPGASLMDAHSFDSVDGDIIGLLLQYEASFVSSYPCYAPNLGTHRVLPKRDSTETTNHPLHSSYHFVAIQVVDLSAHTPARHSECERGDYFVTVINAKAEGGGHGLYVYAKAWCSKWGVDAVVFRESRTCLSCAIREAYAIAATVLLK